MKKFACCVVLLMLCFLVFCSEKASAAIEGTKKIGTGEGVVVTNVTPGDLSSGNSPKTPLTIEFDGGVSPAFYQTVNVSLFQGARQIDGELLYNQNSRQVMFKPAKALEEGMTYTAQLSFGEAGKSGEKVWSFKIRGKNDDSGFSMKDPGQSRVMVAGIGAGAAQTSQSLAIVSANMAQAVMLPESALEISFSEPLDIATLRDAPIQVHKGGQQIGIDYRLSKDMKTITLVPRNPLKGGSDYRVAILNSLTGATGSRITKNIAIPFSVAAGNTSTSYDVPLNVLEEAPEPVSRGFENSGFEAAPRQTSRPPVPAQIPAVSDLEITGLSPRSGDVVSNLSSPVVIAFKGQVREETLNEFTFRLEDDFGPVPAKIRFIPQRNQAILTPVGVLDSGKTYRVVITQGITDVYGRQLSKGLNSVFSTRAGSPSNEAPVEMAAAPTYRQPNFGNQKRSYQAAPSPSFNSSNYQEAVGNDIRELESGDEPPVAANADPEFAENGNQDNSSFDSPRGNEKKRRLSEFKISGIKPPANSFKISRDVPIVIQFNEDAHPSTVNNINISLFGKSERVDGLVSYDSNLKQAVFTPSKQLELGTRYKVLVSDKIKSKSGESLASKASWEFTTIPEKKNVYQPRSSYQSSGNSNSSFGIDQKSTRIGIRQVPQSDENAFPVLPQKHWSFKTVRKMTQKGLLPGNPFKSDMKVSRYEMAMLVNSILGNLKKMGSAQATAKLKTNDFVDIERLVIEFRTELKSTNSYPIWYERFLENQGIRISEIESSMQNS
ncbi:MAG: Ig-like domain-containing protein [Candidatus Riflebacteria bacterium]|nr:Ig-like domain-containing protein [Candidatus Riflebacteria bacterium]